MPDMTFDNGKRAILEAQAASCNTPLVLRESAVRNFFEIHVVILLLFVLLMLFAWSALQAKAYLVWALVGTAALLFCICSAVRKQLRGKAPALALKPEGVLVAGASPAIPWYAIAEMAVRSLPCLPVYAEFTLKTGCSLPDMAKDGRVTVFPQERRVVVEGYFSDYDKHQLLRLLKDYQASADARMELAAPSGQYPLAADQDQIGAQPRLAGEGAFASDPGEKTREAATKNGRKRRLWKPLCIALCLMALLCMFISSGFPQYLLGMMYLDGFVVAKDARKGEEWLQKAVNKGNGRAWIQMEKSRLLGVNTPAENPAVEEWLTVPPVKPGLATHTNGIGMEFVLIPPGSFMLKENEISTRTAQRKMSVSQPFYLGKYEVTQEQWEAVMGNNPSEFKGRNNPVERVSWHDAQEFIKRLNAKEGHNRYRLPTATEWELAARGGTDTIFFFGSSTTYRSAELADAFGLEDYAWCYTQNPKSTRPVGQKEPNQYGLHDVYGNVFEWVEDWHADALPEEWETRDYRGPRSGVTRVARGGSWASTSPAWDCRSGGRSFLKPQYGTVDTGFRLALTPE